MRRSGKTTRAVDDAIQALFKHGSIVVPTNREVEEFYKGQSQLHVLNPDQIIIDPDYHTGNMCQVDIRRKIHERLQLEHDRSFEIDKKANKFSLIKP